MSSEQKRPASTSDFEVESHDLPYQKHLKKVRLVDSARIGLTVLALLCGVTVLGTSSDTLAIYRATHLANDFNLPLWPNQFDIRPSIALVVGSSVVVLANILSLASSKVKMLRNRNFIHSPISFAAPFVGFTAVMISMVFFYAVNTSITDDTLQSWSCQWGFANMKSRPHFGTLCRESQTALYLSVILVPVELIIFTVASYQWALERKATSVMRPRKSGSPTLP
ncbi:hypothetical protein F4779DRAFT_620930 [Xylariaceae sp. FL0662B]|nr:hypothetical protein F4779DRAFT_620930 [Xylariaceae sp. FL0662B]